MKKVNLSIAVSKNKKCLGYCYQMKKGKYEYQNDNDLGLDLDAINCFQTYNKKIYLENGYYIYVLRGIWGDETSEGMSLNLVKLSAKECHPHLFKMTEQEKKKLNKYEKGE